VLSEDGWFKTGDYGYINGRDEVVITGRKKNIIVLNNGKNIYPEEIEGYIQNLPRVLEVVVSGIKNEHGEDVGLLASVYAGEEPIDQKALETDVRLAMRALPSYKQISRLEIRNEPFPKTTTNKIKRTA
jgi:long-chain acyl-CoA synthetase